MNFNETKDVAWESQFEKPETRPEPQTQPVKPVVEKTDIKVPVMTNDFGLLVGKSFEEQYRIAKLFSASEMVPKAYRNRPDNVLAAWQTAIELGLRPYSALRQIAVINGTPSLWGELPLSICIKSGNILSIDEYFVDAEWNRISLKNKNYNQKAHAAVCVIERKNPNRTVESVFSMDDAKTAGLAGKDIWRAYPKRMLQMRARGWALKDCFPEVLSGVAQAEYDFDLMPNESGVYEVNPKEKGFAKKISGKRDETEKPENAQGDKIESLCDLQDNTQH